MKLAAVILALALGGCGVHPLTGPTRVANAAKAVGAAAEVVLQRECVEGYQAADASCASSYKSAQSQAAIEAADKACAAARRDLDAFCGPFTASYRTLRLVHAALLAELAVAEQTGDPTQAMQRAAVLAGAAAQLEEALRGAKP